MNLPLHSILEETWFFRYLSEKQREVLASNSNLVRYSKKDVLFKQHTRTSHLMYVVSGLIRIIKEGRNNKILSLKTITQGEFVSHFSIFGDSIFQYSASSVGESEILIIDYASFVSILQDNGNLGMAMIRRMSKDGIYLINRMMSLSHKQLPGRIAEVLLYFSEEIYKETEFNFPLTRLELAELAGTTKESFIRTINEFKHDKIIELDGRHVRIISMDIVKVLSELG
ncbi:MAG: Crp/Fnr family transcriptional regulator [Bacteroidota bacterium]|nr:Crp/Fnr family transcriptional regulator [Bacteroidota bacterium]